MGNIPVGGYVEVAVTPKLERLYYGHTRKDGGVSTQKNSKKAQAGSEKVFQAPQSNTRDVVTAMTDGDLDELFIDNSPGARRATAADDNLESQNIDVAHFDQPVQESSNATVLKKLKNHLRVKKKSAVEEELQQPV